MRKLKANLSASSLTQLAKDFKSYIGSFDYKCDLMIEKLISAGIPVVESTMQGFKGDSSRAYNYYYEIHRKENSAYGKLVVENEDILFIEFGAGIYWNMGGDSHPKEKEFGYGVGTYPGQTHAFDDEGWWYWDGTKRIHSFGTQAAMPIHNTYLEMANRVIDIAREVFGNG